MLRISQATVIQHPMLHFWLLWLHTVLDGLLANVCALVLRSAVQRK